MSGEREFIDEIITLIAFETFVVRVIRSLALLCAVGLFLRRLTNPAIAVKTFHAHTSRGTSLAKEMRPNTSVVRILTMRRFLAYFTISINSVRTPHLIISWITFLAIKMVAFAPG